MIKIKKIIKILTSYPVPFVFLIISLLGLWISEIPLPIFLNDIIIRMARNTFLVLSLIIPVVVGLGLNFAIVIGAMAGQIGAMISVELGLTGFIAFIVACFMAFPLAIFFGFLVGKLFNIAKGREMITGFIAGFFANGIYQFIFLFLAGSLIPFRNPILLLSQGWGVRSVVDLHNLQYSIDSLWRIKFFLGEYFINVPLSTFILIAFLAISINFFLKTKLGQEFRAIGQDPHISLVYGINVDKNRILATIISIVLASIGQLIFLQNLGTMNTYSSHEQVGLFSIAALLVGGASVQRATVLNAILGTFLFHTLFIISPQAGQKLFGQPQVGEYFRVFIAYGIIALTLALHAMKRKEFLK
ncbi:MAG: hypothetical protein NZ841_07595 [Dictyoglomus sp.]|nr:hypothetical protein [Dictyoglomus sp.]MCX7845647.1 hypothetical protein [Dictyoglomaceae bacterium]MDW8189142.1 hypothetical protein [Dictyoglomus sp.]